MSAAIWPPVTPAWSGTPTRGGVLPSALRTDPKNNELLDRAFISSLADGDIDEAVKLADRILTIRQIQSRLRAGRRRTRSETEEICGRAAEHQSVDIAGRSRICGDAAVGWPVTCRDTKTAIANIDKLTVRNGIHLKDLHAA